MLTILRSIADGKTHWSLEELTADPSILPALQEAHRQGLVEGLLVGPLSKGRYTAGVPLDVSVSGLTPAGVAVVSDQAPN